MVPMKDCFSDPHPWCVLTLIFKDHVFLHIVESVVGSIKVVLFFADPFIWHQRVVVETFQDNGLHLFYFLILIEYQNLREAEAICIEMRSE